MFDSSATKTEKSFIDSGFNRKNYLYTSRCQFKINNEFHCSNQAIEFFCGYCTNKFCLDHLNEHDHIKEHDPILRSNIVSFDSTLNVVDSIGTFKSSSITCTSSCLSCQRSSNCSCTTCSCSFKSTLISEESVLLFHPIAMSTPMNEIGENINHLSTNHLSNILNSTMNNQQYLLDEQSNKSIEVLPGTVASDDLLSLLETTFREKSNMKNPKKKIQGENSIQENINRLNRSNFFLKNITTPMTYMDIFISIGTMYPLVQSNVTETNLSKIQYLCVADTSTTSNKQCISIHICFEKKVNFKHKFLNHLFADLKISDYLFVANGDQFNAEIKSLASEKYIESSVYVSKKGKNVLTDMYRKKQGDIASTVFKQESLPNAIALLKESLPFEYLTLGNQMRNNIEYELQLAKKQKQIECKPLYDSTTFKIPEEHRERIEGWLKNDFQMRIDGKITRSKCLFMVGPTQHGISLEFF